MATNFGRLYVINLLLCNTGCKKNPSENARILEGANQNRTDA